MQALKLPARRGWRWLSEGFRIFQKKSVMLSLLVLSYWVVMILLSTLPLIGQILATVLIPVFSVSLMNACRRIEQGDALPPLLLFSGFEKNLRPLLVLGAVYLASTLAVFSMTLLVDDGVLFRFLVMGDRPDEQALASGDVLNAAQLVLVLILPIVMAYWFAPILVAWHDLPAKKALFFSFIACLRNWRAFVVYLASVVAFGVFLPGLILGLISSSLAGAGGAFISVLTFLSVLILVPTLYASFYVSYREVFVIIDEDV